MNPIGGYFGLESNSNNSILYEDGLFLNSARSSLEYLIVSRDIRKIYLPYYTCYVLLEPLKKHSLEYKFYNIDQDWEIENLIALEDGAWVLYVNYFGLKNAYVKWLSTQLKNLIIDNSQALYSKPLINVDTFYSPRKFFGLPDGGILFTSLHMDMKLEKDVSIDRISHLIYRHEFGAQMGYSEFQKNDAKLSEAGLKVMSNLTKALYDNLDVEGSRLKRNDNFHFLHQNLKTINQASSIIENALIDGPMIYPLLSNIPDLRKRLIDEKIFVANYWPGVRENLNEESLSERNLVDNLVPLPIDQRYDIGDMKVILETIEKIAHG